MIRGFVALLGCQLAGEAISHGTGLPVPGPVLGLVLLLVALRVRGGGVGGEGETGRVADGLLRNLSLLFVPAGVGVLQHLELLTRNGVALAVALIVSTAATLVVTVLVFAGISRAMGLPEEAP